MTKKILVFLIFTTLLFQERTFSEALIYKSATEYDYPPFSVTVDGVADGFSVELLKAVADEINIDIEFKIDQWIVIKSELEEGKLDVLPLVGYTEERDKYLDFTVPYMVMHGNIFVRNDNKDIMSQEDLIDKYVLVMEDDNAHEYAIKNHLTDNLVPVKTYTEAFNLLSMGKYDAILAQSVVGQKLINELGIKNIKALTKISSDANQPTRVELEEFEQKFCFAVKDGNKELLQKLNEGLAIVSANGRYRELYEKWFPFLLEEKMDIKKFIIYVVAMLVFFSILFLVISFFYIKREVKRKTIDLQIANEELEMQKIKAEEASYAKSQFLANMAHEIRTPLNGLLGTVQLFDISNLSDNQQELLEITKKSSNVLLRVINDILDYSKIEADMIKIDNNPIDLMKLLNDLVNLFEPAAMERGLLLNLDVEESVPKIIFGDGFRLRQILFNLIGNSIKFTYEGKIDLHLKLEKINGNSSLHFVVKDTGIGISSDKKDLLFKRFSQVDISNKRTEGGTGLGLAISRGLALKMKGDLWAEGFDKKGIAFHFLYPINPSDTELLKKSLKSDKIEKSSTIKNKPHILIAEDDYVSGLVAKKMAERFEVQVKVVENGIEAVDEFKKNKYNIIFMDVQMPKMDGFEATAEIRKLEADGRNPIPIIALSAFALKGDKEKCLSACMDDYMSKPIMMDEFKEKIEFWCKNIDLMNIDDNFTKEKIL